MDLDAIAAGSHARAADGAEGPERSMSSIVYHFNTSIRCFLLSDIIPDMYLGISWNTYATTYSVQSRRNIFPLAGWGFP